ncbi:hypothetical protein AAVH_20212, partial [Aphelenchoides avenae]
MTSISIVALPLTANRLFDVLQALVPALGNQDASYGKPDDLPVIIDYGMTPQEAAERRL